MRLRGCRLVAALLAALSCGTAAPTFPEYQTGDAANADIVTPVPLVVIDPVRTEALRQKEQQRMPAIFRFDPHAADEAEAALREAFTNARTAFLSVVRSAFGKSVLEVAELNTPQFRKTTLEFDTRQAAFPLATELAQLWALGAAGAVIQIQWTEWLRSAMARPLVDDVAPPAAKAGPMHVRLIVSQPLKAVIDLADAERASQTFARTNILVLSRARNEWQSFFPGADAGTGEFLASFLRQNCAFDVQLTTESRARAVQGIYAADRYEAGTMLARQGQHIDAKIKRALDELRLRTTELPPSAKVIATEPDETVENRPPGSMARAVAEPMHSRAPSRWLIVAATASVGIIVIAALLPVAMRRRATSRQLACVGEVELVTDDPNAASWQERALTAEQKLEKLRAIVRAGLIPNLAQWLSQHFVRSLVAERAQMVDAHKLAEMELSQLEERLTALQTPLTERLQAYEQRIAELEQHLAAKDQENRELIETKIEMTRKQLEAERGAEPSWN